MASVAFVHTSAKAISECREKKFSQLIIQNNHSRKVPLKPVCQTLACCGRRRVDFKTSYVPITKEEGKSKVLSRRFCKFDSGAEEKLFTVEQ